MRIFFIVLLAFLIAGCDQLSKPSNFDECILKYMQGVTSDAAATSIYRSCRRKFPRGYEARQRSRKLSPIEIMKLDGKGSMSSYGSSFAGEIHNGNRNLTITSITIKLVVQSDGKEIPRKYSEDITIPPLQTEHFSVSVLKGDQKGKFSWGIVSAMGYRK